MDKVWKNLSVLSVLVWVYHFVCHGRNVFYALLCLGSVWKNLKITRLKKASFFAEYCPTVSNFGLQWPRISLGEHITKNCSAMNSSWTGTCSRYRFFKNLVAKYIYVGTASYNFSTLFFYKIGSLAFCPILHDCGNLSLQTNAIAITRTL